MKTIKLNTNFHKKAIWLEKPFGKGQALIDLILLADEKGQVVISIKELAIRWGWGEKKTKLYLSSLQKQQYIKFSSQRSLGTVILIVNYDGYVADKKEQRKEEKHTIKVL